MASSANQAHRVSALLLVLDDVIRAGIYLHRAVDHGLTVM